MQLLVVLLIVLHLSAAFAPTLLGGWLEERESSGELVDCSERLGVEAWVDKDPTAAPRPMSARVAFPGDFASGGGGVCIRDMDCCLSMAVAEDDMPALLPSFE